ncbi:MAG: N4-gp56 family major capsid protein [Acutalibacteraceae bacterium]|nr:N4-gp56 family major capsid protein [Acutalibacteraceae bacterium]
MKELLFNIQLFAELNTNTTTQTGSGKDLSAENKTYYDKMLIKLAAPNLIHNQFGQKRNIPKNNGKTIEFRKFTPLGKATTPLTEGVTPNGQSLDVTALTATVHQYGGYVTISDNLELTALDPMVQETIGLISDQAAQTIDTVERDILVTGTNVQYADGSVEGRSALTSSHKMTVDVLKRAVRTLKKLNTPKIDGYYVAIMHPSVAYDLMADPEWIDAQKHTPGNVEKLFKGEIGEIAGVKVVESTEAKIWASAGSGGASVYATLVLGKDAYGVTDIEGGGLQTIIKAKGSAGTADPLDQRSTVGWKANHTAEILVQEYMVRVETASSFNDEAN